MSNSEATPTLESVVRDRSETGIYLPLNWNGSSKPLLMEAAPVADDCNKKKLLLNGNHSFFDLIMITIYS